MAGRYRRRVSPVDISPRRSCDKSPIPLSEAIDFCVSPPGGSSRCRSVALLVFFFFLPAVPGHPTKPLALRAWLKTLEIPAKPSSRWGRAGRSRGFRTPSFDRSRLFRAPSAFRMRVSNGPVLRQHGSADGSGMPFAQWPAPGVRGGERDPGAYSNERAHAP